MPSTLLKTLYALCLVLLLESCSGRGIPSGEPKGAAEIYGVSDQTTLNGIVWSPDSTGIGFTSFDPDTGRTKIVLLDMQTKSITEPLASYEPNASIEDWPEHDKIAFSSAGEIYTYDTARREISLFRSGRRAAWSRNGLEAAVFVPDQGIFVVDSATRLERLTYETAGNQYIYGLSWSPSGQMLAFSVQDRDTWSDTVTVLDVAQNKVVNPTKVTPGYSPTWSPDGSRLAYLRTGQQPLDVSMVLWDLGSDCWSVEVNGAWSLAWSPDGKYLAYSTNQAIHLIPADIQEMTTTCG